MASTCLAHSDALMSLQAEDGEGEWLAGGWAGWGGCTVSLVEQGQEQAFIAAVKEAYYRPLQDSGRLEADPAWDDIIFASKPASGGAILRLDL